VESIRRNTPITSVAPDQKTGDYNLVFPAALAFSHRAFANCDNLALAAADIFLLGALPFAAILFATPARIFAKPAALSFLLGAVPLIFAHRALAAAAIAARPAALIFLFFGAGLGAD